MTLCYTFWFLESISKRLVFYSYRKIWIIVNEILIHALNCDIYFNIMNITGVVE